MAITEQDRIRLYRYFEGEMGEDLATKMMDSLPPAGWGDIATKSDIAEVRADLQREIGDVRKDVAHEFTVFRQEMNARFDSVDQKFEIVEHKFGRMLHRALLEQTFVIAAVVSAVAALTDFFGG